MSRCATAPWSAQVPRPPGACRQHELLGWLSDSIEVVANNRSIHQPDGREQWALTLVAAMRCHVNQLCAIDGMQKSLTRRLSAGEHLAPRPVLCDAGDL